MYRSNYSQYSSGAQKKMQYRSKGKSCGYYMRIIFFFSSLIQSLIIVSLVLFLIYGKTQDSASTSRIQDLEESFSRLSIENVALRHQRKNLTTLLNTTMMNNARNDYDLAQLRYVTNISVGIIQDLNSKLTQCSGELFLCKSTRSIGPCQPSPPTNCNCGLLFEKLQARLQLVESNFTQTKQRMSNEMDQIAKQRDTINLDVIHLRREKFTHEKEVEFFRQKCKDDFAQSLSGVSNVSRAFLEKIDSLFPTHIAFQLTCPKQREHLEQIRTNCSSLSREVEDRFQRYLNSVGQQVSSIQAESSRLKAENWRLTDDYRWCSQNRTGQVQQHKQNLDKLQQKHDEDKEKLLLDKMRLNGEIEVLENNVKFKTKQVEHLAEKIKQLNLTCMSKTVFGVNPGSSTSRAGTSQIGWGMFGGGGSSSASSSSSGVGQLSRTGSGGLGSSFSSSQSAFNKPVPAGAGSSSSSLLSTGSGSSIGSAFNKPGSTGAGSSSSSLLTSGSSSSTGGAFSSFGSTGSNPSSSGVGANKSVLSGRGSSSFGSSSGSTGSIPNLSSTGTGLNKPTTSVKSSPGIGSSSGSTGSTSKSGSTGSGFSWLGFGSNTGQSKTGSGTGKGTSSGNSFGGTGSSTGAGRTSTGGQVNVAQHIKDLQRIINPSGSEEKQDLFRMLG